MRDRRRNPGPPNDLWFLTLVTATITLAGVALLEFLL